MEINFIDTVDSLDELLEQERDALLCGNLDLISRLFENKENLIKDLNAASDPNDVMLTSLNRKIARNQALLSSALEGIKSVADRFAMMRQIKESLDIYDAFGQRKKIEILSVGSIEKRA